MINTDVDDKPVRSNFGIDNFDLNEIGSKLHDENDFTFTSGENPSIINIEGGKTFNQGIFDAFNGGASTNTKTSPDVKINSSNSSNSNPCKYDYFIIF